jgi:LysM repeat protein
MIEDRPQQNQRPKDDSKRLPILVLGVMSAIIIALFYIGWDLLSDDPSVADGYTTNVPDSVSRQMPTQSTDPEETANTDTSSSINGSGGLPPLTIPKVGDKKDDKQATATKPEDKKVEKVPEKTAETPKVSMPTGSESHSHTVADGETFNGIANRYNLKVSTLRGLNNNIDPEGIKVGVTKLKVPVQGVHTVGPGDILRVVAQKYGITVEALMAANKRTKNRADRGEKLIIPLKEKQ